MDLKQYEFKSEFAKRHRAEGRAEGRAEALVTVLTARGFVVADLDRWLVLAVSVATIDELLSAHGDIGS